MELSLTVLLGLVALICFLGGINILLKGVRYFLPDQVPTPLVLDNLLRFLSGIYFGAGFLFIYTAFHVTSLEAVPSFLGFMVLCSGLGRLLSALKTGSAGKYFNFIMWLEIILGITIMLLSWLI